MHKISLFAIKLIVISSVALINVSCGGEDDDPLGTSNQAPELSGSFDVTSAEEGVIYRQAVKSQFTDDGGDITIEVTEEGDSELPDWLQYDADRDLLFGVPGEDDAGEHELLVVATDSEDLSIEVEFTLTVNPIVSSLTDEEIAADEAFYNELLLKEAGFYALGVGVDATTAISQDGYNLDRDTLELIPNTPRNWSASSKECLHVAILAKALLGDPRAQLMIGGESLDPVAVAVDILEQKMTTYETFDETYPAFGGFFPWVVNQDRDGSGIKLYPTNDWPDKLPSLDNGQLAWSIYVVYKALHDIGEVDLAARYEARFNQMAANAKTIFLVNGEIIAESQFSEADTVPPSGQTYATPPNTPWILNDPYEGELMTLFMLLFSPDITEDEKQALLDDKLILTRDYTDVDGDTLTAIEGWAFSAHEQWKFLQLPYLDHPLARNLFINGEKVRADYSNQNDFDGFFASGHDSTGAFTSLMGVVGMGFAEPIENTFVTPYGGYPLIIVDDILKDNTGLDWLRNVLAYDKMIGPYGMTESYDTIEGPNPYAIAPLITWDNKGTLGLSFAGGTYDEVREYLIEDGLYLDFIDFLDEEYGEITATISNTDKPIALPLPGDPHTAPCPEPDFTIISDFECQQNFSLTNVNVVDNPNASGINTSASVGSYTDPIDEWSSLIIDTGSAIDLATNNQLKIKVWAPVTGVLKARLAGGTSDPVELDLNVTATEQWVEYSYDLTALSGQNHNSVAFFFGAGVTPLEGTVYYIDDIRFDAAGACNGVTTNPAIFNDFECQQNQTFTNVAVVDNPDSSGVNTSVSVGSYTDPAEDWAALIINTGASIDLSTDNQLKIKVWAPATGTLKAKFEGASPGSPTDAATVERDREITTTGEWVEYSYDFSHLSEFDYSTLTLFFNAGVGTSGTEVYYIDDIQFVAADACEGVVADASIFNDFECQQNQAFTNVTVVDNPDSSGANTSASVGSYTDPTGAWDALIINTGATIDLSTNNQVKIKVWAPVTGTLKAKFEGASGASPTDGATVERDQQVTTTNSWVEYAYDFSHLAAFDYSTLTFFFNAGVDTSGTDVYYIDDVQLEAAP